MLAGGLRLGRLVLRGAFRAALGTARVVRAHWYRVCGTVLIVLAVAGLVATLAGPLLIAVTGAR